MSPFRAGLLAVIVIGLFTYFGFTKANPFANPYELQAVFDTANNLKPRSPVRIAGVDVGKVTTVEPITEGEGGARVTMEIQEKGLPIHADAQLKIRPRIFLEGNQFVDVKPGSPSARELDDGSTIPITQTASPVQLAQVLTALQSDTREDLQVLLREFSKGLEGAGARGFNQSIRYWEPAYKYSALANDATLGEEPTRDLQRVLRGQQRTFAALVEDEAALKDLVTNFNVTAGAFAREDVALEAAIPALRDTLRAAQPALQSLNDALPSLRAFSRDALPGVRSSNPTLAASLPFIRQARKLVSERELRGAARALRRYIPSLVRLNVRSVDLSEEGRQLSACTNKVLVPWQQSQIPNPDEPENTNQKVREQIQRGFPGLAGESRLSDANGSFFHGSAVALGDRVRPAPPTDGGDTPPPHRPDVPCELQPLPNLHAPGGPQVNFPAPSGASASSATSSSPARPASPAKLRALTDDLRDALRKMERGRKARQEKLQRKEQER